MREDRTARMSRYPPRTIVLGARSQALWGDDISFEHVLLNESSPYISGQNAEKLPVAAKTAERCGGKQILQHADERDRSGLKTKCLSGNQQ